MLPAR